MHLFVYVYTCTYVCMYVCMYVRMYVCMYVCRKAGSYVHMHASMHTYTCVYIYIYIYLYIHVNICVWIHSMFRCLHESTQSPNISISECWWYIAFPQVLIHVVSNILHKWKPKLNNKKRKEKTFTTKKYVNCSHIHIKNSSEHRVTVKYSIYSDTVEMKNAVCIMHWKENSKLLTLF
jgi:hypothetical protein